MNKFTVVKDRLIGEFPAVPAEGKAFGMPAHLTPLWQAFGAALKVPDAMSEKAPAVRSDRNLSEIGKREALHNFAIEVGAPALRQVVAAVKEADARRAAIEATMAASTVDKSDLAAAVLRSEVRSWLKTLKPSERAAMLALDPVDPTIAAAVIEAPPQLAGVLPRQRERLARAVATARHPAEAKQLEELQQGVDALGSAWRLAQQAIETEAGASVIPDVEAAAGLPNAREEILARLRAELGTAE